MYDDLRFYALVQFFAIAMVPLMFALFPSKYVELRAVPRCIVLTGRALCKKIKVETYFA